MIPSGEEFNLDSFAQELATQAAEAFPPELPDHVKNAIAQVVYEFIRISGNALNQEEHQYNLNETVLICQLVGEWMFHKGIDIFKNQIPEDRWRDILQQLAFVIFEHAKNGVLQATPQDVIINDVENAVQGAYRTIIEQLSNEGLLGDKSIDEVMQQSNLKDYVEQSYEEGISESTEEKDLKLMTMALFLKNFPPAEVGNIIKFLGDAERRQLATYIQMPELERLVDPVLYNQYLEKFHNFMPKVKLKKRKESMYSGVTEAITRLERSSFARIINNERRNVKNFLLKVYDGKMYEEELFSLELTNTIINHTEQKVSHR